MVSVHNYCYVKYPCSLLEINVNSDTKLSLVGMQLPEEYTEKFDVSSESPCREVS